MKKRRAYADACVCVCGWENEYMYVYMVMCVYECVYTYIHSKNKKMNGFRNVQKHFKGPKRIGMLT